MQGELLHLSSFLRGKLLRLLCAATRARDVALFIAFLTYLVLVPAIGGGVTCSTATVAGSVCRRLLGGLIGARLDWQSIH